MSNEEITNELIERDLRLMNSYNNGSYNAVLEEETSNAEKNIAIIKGITTESKNLREGFIKDIDN